MRYIFPLLIVLLFASCKKQSHNYPYKSTFLYHNNSSHYVQIALYHTNSSTRDSLLNISSGNSLYAEFSGSDGLPTPFYNQMPDSLEMVFDSTKKIIYTLTGDNGFGKSRNLLNKGDKAYDEKPQGPRVSFFEYFITSADYANAH